MREQVQRRALGPEQRTRVAAERRDRLISGKIFAVPGTHVNGEAWVEQAEGEKRRIEPGEHSFAPRDQ